MSLRRHWVIERSGALFPEQLTAIRFPPRGRPTEYVFAPNDPHPRTFATLAQADASLAQMPREVRVRCRVVERP